VSRDEIGNRIKEAFEYATGEPHHGLILFGLSLFVLIMGSAFDPNFVHNPKNKLNVRAPIGGMFADYLYEYTHWGWVDIDLVMGDMSKLIEDLKLNYDINSYTSGVSG
jgi:hypothetical protein